MNFDLFLFSSRPNHCLLYGVCFAHWRRSYYPVGNQNTFPYQIKYVRFALLAFRDCRKYKNKSSHNVSVYMFYSRLKILTLLRCRKKSIYKYSRCILNVISFNKIRDYFFLDWEFLVCSSYSKSASSSDCSSSVLFPTYEIRLISYLNINV